MSIAQCDLAPQLSVATRKRLLLDLKRLQEEPVPLASASPCSDDDLSLWDGIIGVEMQVSGHGKIVVPLHFLIDFAETYPQSAPNIGFSFPFRYDGGAEYIMPGGRLKGKKVICLDILGNFGGIHTEWKQSVGSGWTAAYNVTTLLVQLQSVLADVGVGMSQSERDTTYASAIRFAKENPASMVALQSEEEIRHGRAARAQASKVLKLCGGDSRLAARVEEFTKKAKFAEDQGQMEAFVELLSSVVEKNLGGGGGAAASSGTAKEPEVDSNICCFSTGKLYTEAILGVGVSRAKQNLATAGELLSKDAFDNGLRQSTNKSPFEFFIPVWINAKHAADSKEWLLALKSSYMNIGKTMYSTTDEDTAILEVFPRLINQLIVEMMRPDAAKSEAIATFEAMVNFWRTLRFLVESSPSLQKRISTQLTGFVKSEEHRHKDTAPDLGALLVLFTVYQTLPGCPERCDFMNAYVDENALRWVMWWRRSGAKPASKPVFDATVVSRNIAMFQAMVVDVIIGDVAETLLAMEASNCKLPDRLERLQAEWRKRKEGTVDWETYFANIGASKPTQSMDSWIAECVTRAAAKGPKYGGEGGKGQSKGGKGGGGGGKGGGRGWGNGGGWNQGGWNQGGWNGGW